MKFESKQNGNGNRTNHITKNQYKQTKKAEIKQIICGIRSSYSLKDSSHPKQSWSYLQFRRFIIWPIKSPKHRHTHTQIEKYNDCLNQLTIGEREDATPRIEDKEDAGLGEGDERSGNG